MATREAPPTGSIDVFAAVGPSLGTLPAGMRLWMEDAERLRAESLRFVVDRFGKDARLAAALAACRRPKELFDLQAAGLRECASDYLRESARLTSMSVQAWRHGLNWLGASVSARQARAS